MEARPAWDLLNSLVVPDGQTCSQRMGNTASKSLPQQEARKPHIPALPRTMENEAAKNSFVLSPSGQVSREHEYENIPPFAYPLMTMDDFEREHHYSPEVPKPKLVPINGKGGTLIIPQFNHLCQLHRFQPSFTVSEVAQGAFTAKVVFGSSVEEVHEAFPSKQAAKEAVCKRAITHLESVGGKAGSKRKAEYVDVPTPELDTSENWIGILMEYTQREKIPRPEYKGLATLQNPTQYACTLSIEGGPPRLFGSEDFLFPTKQGAKATAAKEAVLWLREQGKLPAAGIKRQKVVDTAQLREGSTGLTQMMRGFGVESTLPLPQRLHEKVFALGFHSPIYELEHSQTPGGRALSAAGFWDVAVTFDERDVAVEPRLAGRLGETKHVFGKQKAKDACCEKVLQVLEEIERSRISQ